MLHHPPRSPTWVGYKPEGKPIRPDWDGDTLPVHSYQERNSEPLPISRLNAVQFNSGQNSFALSAIDPQPSLSSTYKKEGLGIVPQVQIE